MEASDIKPTNCHFCNEPSPMFPLDGANLAICGGCLVETVHSFFTERYAELEAKRSEQEEEQV